MAALSSSHAPTRIAHVKNREGESFKGRDLISGGGINECEFNRVLLVLFDEEINRVVITVDSDCTRWFVLRLALLTIRVITVGQVRLEFQVEGLAADGANVCDHGVLVIVVVTTTDVVFDNL